MQDFEPSLNTILYGPPGTGKTYTSIERAVQIVDGQAPATRDECMARFKALRSKKQVEFVTFHQSFAYEDFIEGLRPILDEESTAGARYAVRDGIFKTLAQRALGDCLEPAQQGRATFDEVWSAFCHQVESHPEENYAGLTPGSQFEIEVTSAGNLRGRNVKSRRFGTRYLCSRAQAEAVWRQFPDTAVIDSGQVKTVAGNSHIHFIAVVFRELKHIEQQISPPHERDFTPEEAACSLLDGGEDYRVKDSCLNSFVLIIDEINRGNISRIFGELITLLEDDKRLGAPNELRATLPYSGKTFALPGNLHVIGTMNTADKSLALLDVALRRRFTFEEIAPNFELCTHLNHAMRAVLHELNKRLMLVLDRDHRIGHAFFMQVENASQFNAVFANKIVPLLQEYFYNDWDGLRSILGEKNDGHIVKTIAPIEGLRGRNRYGWWSDVDLAQPDFLAVLQKNYGIKRN
jgi:5-methylcytosine-specific restriction protein B